ncbi:MAG: EAL domain-containing protein [Anaerolineaceae bacterium]|nr:EAL domain-containing protein [Anaerolineaceae bacterium]
MIRQSFVLIYGILILALVICLLIARKSKKSIAPSVAMLLVGLIPPVSGNLLIIASTNRIISTIGYYIYFLGMNFVMYALLRFTLDYCLLKWPNRAVRNFVHGLLLVDTIQYFLNPIFHQAFTTEAIKVGGYDYYRLVPFFGQVFHRVVDYGIFFAVLIIFFVKVIKTPRIYSERYSTLLITMILVGVWETFYIFSRSPIDRSMIGFGVFGLVVFYFALYYRPMRLLDRMLANIASDMPDALFFFDAVGRCIWVNESGIKLAKLEKDNFEPATERLIRMFKLENLKSAESIIRTQYTYKATDGMHYYVLEKHCVSDDHGRVTGSFLTIRDNTEEQRAFEQQQYNIHHDELTGLFTREYLYDRIKKMIQTNPGTEYYIVFVDANNFKVVNDIYGAEFGDYALKVLADWVRNTFAGKGVYGRIAGDMFGVCVPVEKFDEEQLNHDLTNFVVKDGKVEHPLLVHLGVYKVVEPGLDISVMFDRARVALSTIKDEFSKHIAYYDDNMKEKILWDQLITSQLHRAMETREIRPYLQPIVDSAGKVVGAEALVRWLHPVDGLLNPGSFMPVFERNGLVAEVDKYMWRYACEILARWKEEGRNLFISVNISPKDFYFMNVADEIKSVVHEFGVDPSKMRVEITETAMMEDIDNRVKVLNDLQQNGFMVEMDDFGSGYSSLNMLKDMPVEVIKLDMVFLKKSSNNHKAKKILNHIVKLSDDLGVTSLTEGVETYDQYEMLVDMGCKLFQGFYFAKPMPEDEFDVFCLKNQ